MSFKILTEKRPEVIICLNGEIPSKKIFDYFTEIPIAAADGAASQLQKLGIDPMFIIGDLDSIKADIQYWQNKLHIELIEIPNQNATDFEKVMDVMENKGFKTMLIVGMHGHDIDHTLNNWSILLRYAQRPLELAVYDKGKIALVIRNSVRFKTKPEEMISLIPLPEATLSTEGLRWNLRQEKLALGYREGARNRATGKNVTITLHEGAYSLIIEDNLPNMPVQS